MGINVGSSRIAAYDMGLAFGHGKTTRIISPGSKSDLRRISQSRYFLRRRKCTSLSKQNFLTNFAQTFHEIITGAPPKVGAHFVLIGGMVIFVFYLVFLGKGPASCETFRAFFLG